MKQSFGIWRMLRARRSGLHLTEIVMGTCLAMTTLLLVVAAAANVGLDRRTDRTAWRLTPDNAVDSTGERSARMLTMTDEIGNERITRVLYRPTGPDAPIPPGLDRQAAPGELFVSPALAAIIDRQPGVAGRYRDPAGIIDADSLVWPGELLAIEGATPGDPWLAEGDDLLVPPPFHGPVTIDRFALDASHDDYNTVYRALAAMGTVMIVVPALSMAAAGARVVATRRARELALLRLLGARSSRLAAFAAWDVALPAAVGVTASLALSFPALAALSRFPVQGAPWLFRDLVPPPLLLLGLAVLTVLTAVGAAVTTIRRVTQDPLAVAVNRRRRHAWWLRVLVFAGAVIGFLQAANSQELTRAALLAWIALLTAIAVAGPVVVLLLGHLRLVLSRSGPGLVAARRILDDPVAAYRQIGPMALAAFVAGMLAALTALSVRTPDSDLVHITFPPGTFPDIAIDADEHEVLDVVGPFAQLDRSFQSGSVGAFVVRLNRGVDREMVRSLLFDHDPGLVMTSSETIFIQEVLLLEDLSRASLILLAVVGAASALGAAALGVGGIIDQQRPLTALRTVGVPLAALRVARRKALVTPAAASTLLAGVAGMSFCLLWLDEAMTIGPFLLVSVFAAGAVGLAFVTEAVLGPLLDRTTSDRRVLEG